MNWWLTNKGDQRARRLADRHYSRRSKGSKQFVGPGRCVVLVAGVPVSAVWVTTWPKAEYVKHAWPDAWTCTIFRSERGRLTFGKPDERQLVVVNHASEMITEAVAVTRYMWGEAPRNGIITFVDAGKVKTGTPGYSFLRAGWKEVGQTKGGLIVLQLGREKMPDPVAPWNAPYKPRWDGKRWHNDALPKHMKERAV